MWNECVYSKFLTIYIYIFLWAKYKKNQGFRKTFQRILKLNSSPEHYANSNRTWYKKYLVRKGALWLFLKGPIFRVV